MKDIRPLIVTGTCDHWRGLAPQALAPDSLDSFRSALTEIHRVPELQRLTGGSDAEKDTQATIAAVPKVVLSLMHALADLEERQEKRNIGDSRDKLIISDEKYVKLHTKYCNDIPPAIQDDIGETLWGLSDGAPSFIGKGRSHFGSSLARGDVGPIASPTELWLSRLD